jgi:hypothetical protein
LFIFPAFGVPLYGYTMNLAISLLMGHLSFYNRR